MIKIETFSDVFINDVARDVENFLNSKNGIQILDISWCAKRTVTVCIITYMEV